MATRTVNRNQRAVYAGGSKAKGWYQYSLDGYETKGASRQSFVIEGEQKPTQDEAIKSAWQAAREWVAETGECVKTEQEYRSEF